MLFFLISCDDPSPDEICRKYAHEGSTLYLTPYFRIYTYLDLDDQMLVRQRGVICLDRNNHDISAILLAEISYRPDLKVINPYFIEISSYIKRIEYFKNYFYFEIGPNNGELRIKLHSACPDAR
jgi:hypothetical protein